MSYVIAIPNLKFYRMLKGRSFVYYPKIKLIKVSGLPPQGWEDLTNKEQFKEFNNLTNLDVEIIASQFDY